MFKCTITNDKQKYINILTSSIADEDEDQDVGYQIHFIYMKTKAVKIMS